ncbi:MAG TPA: LapA family protein [bacterium]|nr:LapA family protein [bacterium]
MKFKAVMMLVLGVLCVVFVLQNTQVVTFKFLLWEFGASRALLPVIFIGIGLLVGLFLKARHGSKP